MDRRKFIKQFFGAGILMILGTLFGGKLFIELFRKNIPQPEVKCTGGLFPYITENTNHVVYKEFTEEYYLDFCRELYKLYGDRPINEIYTIIKPTVNGTKRIF